MQQIVPGAYLIEGLRGSQAYLLASGEGWTLVDSGTAGEGDHIVAQLESEGCALSDLRAIVLTHCHADHTGNVADLARRSGAEVLAHRDEVPYIEGSASLPTHSLVRRLLTVLSERVFKTAPCPVDRTLQDGDVLDALGGLRVIHAPGHTPGSIALYQPERQILFCGDILFNELPFGGRKQVQAPPRFFSVDPAQAEDSARVLAALPIEVLCSGHGAPILEGAGAKARLGLGIA